jgi:aryl-alcohol dehydrogenase-like predicted oxidoreductase
MTLIDTADAYGPYTNEELDLPRDDFRRGLPRFQQDALRINLAIVEQAREVARRAGASPAQVALA